MLRFKIVKVNPGERVGGVGLLLVLLGEVAYKISYPYEHSFW